MNGNSLVNLTRDVEATAVPSGTKVTLQAGEEAHITQDLGNTFTVIINGNMFRIDGVNADALGREVRDTRIRPASGTFSREELEKEIWGQLRTVFDPEIPVNVADLGLIYACDISPIGEASHKVEVKMTLTAPGCGMGPVLVQDVQNKLLCIEGVDDVNVELVWEPTWNQSMMTEAAKLQLGLL